jgi:hypothetical protein
VCSVVYKTISELKRTISTTLYFADAENTDIPAPLRSHNQSIQTPLIGRAPQHPSTVSPPTRPYKRNLWSNRLPYNSTSPLVSLPLAQGLVLTSSASRLVNSTTPHAQSYRRRASPHQPFSPGLSTVSNQAPEHLCEQALMSCTPAPP